ncbi:MAG: hypothetical protein K9J06_00635 [Flavobacteriales bacterium]|nr:hypothetical protein [Flavobacteriales bacterium]
MRKFIALGAVVALLGAAGCKHEPLTPFIDGPNPDTTDGCDPSTVYFQNEVMPIFASSCAVPGCHDAATAEKDVVLDSYLNIVNTGDVSPGNPGNSDVYEMITENDPNDRMPPQSSGITLTPDQINTIYEWIGQGAENNFCADSGPCDTVAVSFAEDIQPILSTHCLGCHSGSAPQGGVLLTGHQQVSVVVANGLLLGVVSHLPGYVTMPRNQPRLADCKVALIRNWIEQGAPDN